MQTLQAKEIELVEKEEYDSASSIASTLLELERNMPQELQKLLQEQGPRDDVLDACDALVANVVHVDPQETMGLERAYKRMRHT